jgi:hypothetical protein
MKAATGSEATCITIIARTTAAIIIATWFARPMAVVIESSENTRSITMSCATTIANDCVAT